MIDRILDFSIRAGFIFILSTIYACSFLVIALLIYHVAFQKVM